MPDELHLFLRVMDVLIENIISQAVESDIKASRRQTDVLSGQKLQTLVSKINLCGVSFQIWKKRDSKNLDWTSLGGAEKKKVLSQLPKSFSEFLPPEHCQRIAKLWKVHVSVEVLLYIVLNHNFIYSFLKDFENLYEDVCSWSPDANTVERKVNNSNTPCTCMLATCIYIANRQRSG